MRTMTSTGRLVAFVKRDCPTCELIVPVLGQLRAAAELEIVTQDDPAYLSFVVDRIPMGHVGQIRDVAGAVIYLASDAGALVNGSVLAVDGGWTAQ